MCYPHLFLEFRSKKKINFIDLKSKFSLGTSKIFSFTSIYKCLVHIRID